MDGFYTKSEEQKFIKNNRNIPFWFSSSLDLFGSEISTNAATAFANGLKGRPNESQYDEKTDIWSTGCVIYELVSLKPPFTAGNHLALAEKILAGKIERIPDRYSEDL